MPRSVRVAVPVLAAMPVLAALAVLAGVLGVLRLAGDGSSTYVAAGGSPAAADVTWVPCDDAEDGTWECGWVLVPVDHADPDGAQLELALRRLPATGSPEERIGTLFMNPGGPGASGTAMVVQYGLAFSPEVRAAFDLVGFDPRGVTGSLPAIPCEPPSAGLLPAGDPVDWQAYFDRVGPLAAAWSTACQVSIARAGPHLGTNAVVQDLDLLRQAVGDEQLTYWGVSYGTRIGEVYAQRYPERVRAMVLDGNVDPASTIVTFSSERGGAFDRAFAFFVDQHPGSEDDVEVVLDALAEGPMEVIDQITGEPTQLSTDTFLAEVVMGILPSEALWPLLAGEIAALADQVEGGPAASVLRVRVEGNAAAVNGQVNCLDLPGRASPDELVPVAEGMADAGPLFGRYVASGMVSCSAFPLPVDPVPHAAPPADELAPVLLLASRHDPATPYRWVDPMSDLLAGSRVVTYEGVQHGVWNASSACVDEAADAYVLDLALPDQGTTCPFVAPVAPEPPTGAPASNPLVRPPLP